MDRAIGGVSRRKEDKIKASWAEVSMNWEQSTRHTVQVGTTHEEIRRTRRIYTGYWTIHRSKPYNHVCGGGRPFSAECLNSNCGQTLDKLTTLVGVKEANYAANTPVLGWCACVCCRRCIMTMPVLGSGWRKCPGCGDTEGRQDEYLMYPLTREGADYNRKLGRESQKKRRGTITGQGKQEER